MSLHILNVHLYCRVYFNRKTILIIMSLSINLLPFNFFIIMIIISFLYPLLLFFFLSERSTVNKLNSNKNSLIMIHTGLILVEAFGHWITDNWLQMMIQIALISELIWCWSCLNVVKSKNLTLNHIDFIYTPFHNC